MAKRKQHQHRPTLRFGSQCQYGVCACRAHLVETFQGWQPVLPTSRAYLAALPELRGLLLAIEEGRAR